MSDPREALRLAPEAESGPPAQEERLELAYLDGLRGLAALAVALFHAFMFTGRSGEAEEALPWVVGHSVGLGYLGVSVFIVLSGYVLMLPIARHPDLRIPGGARSFLRRRARRILPPYYAALLLSLILVGIFPLMQRPAGTQWDTKLPITSTGVLTHLFLVHDLNETWISQINGPLWSVAVEWELYLLMPFVLLPLWRHIPPWVLLPVLTAAAMTLAILDIGTFAHPWFLTLFTGGMLAAQKTYGSLRTTAVSCYGPLCLTGLIVLAALIVAMLRGDGPGIWLTESIAGIATSLFLAWAGRRAISGRQPLIARVFSTRSVVRLGLVSYSVYLLHSPLLALANLMTLSLNFSTTGQYLFMTLVALPAVLVVCTGFYWLVERRFRNTRQRHIAEALNVGQHG